MSISRRCLQVLVVVTLLLAACAVQPHTAAPSPQTAAATAAAPALTAAPSLSTGTPRPEASLLHFSVDRAMANPGDTITFSWEVSGTPGVILTVKYWAEVELPARRDLVTLPARAMVTYTLPLGYDPEQYPGWPDKYTFRLRTSDGALLSGPASNELLLTFPCSTPLVFSLPADWAPEDTCGIAQAVTGPAAVQLFERGMMLRPPDQPQTIFVLAPWPGRLNLDTEGGFFSFDDAWKSGDLESDPHLVPPEGRYQPVRGFGQIWRGETGAGAMRLGPDLTVLGWATAPERTFTTTAQYGRTTLSYYFRDPQGRLIGVSTYAGHGAIPSWRILDGP